MKEEEEEEKVKVKEKKKVQVKWKDLTLTNKLNFDILDISSNRMIIWIL